MVSFCAAVAGWIDRTHHADPFQRISESMLRHQRHWMIAIASHRSQRHAEKWKKNKSENACANFRSFLLISAVFTVRVCVCVCSSALLKRRIGKKLENYGEIKIIRFLGNTVMVGKADGKRRARPTNLWSSNTNMTSMAYCVSQHSTQDWIECDENGDDIRCSNNFAAIKKKLCGSKFSGSSWRQENDKKSMERMCMRVQKWQRQVKLSKRTNWMI